MSAFEPNQDFSREGAAVPLALPAPAMESARLSSRIGWFFLAAIPFAVILTARMLVPDPAGHGTHTQLGLPPCGFLVLTGCPCPGCGLTTSFAHMARLDFFGAARANPFGIPLFLVSFFTIPVAIRGFLRGESVFDVLDRHHAEKVSAALAICGITVWIVRATMHFFS